MLERVVENCRTLDPTGQVRVLTQAEVGKTRGTAETLARAGDLPDEPLTVANCDQLLGFPEVWRRSDADGILFTFPSASPAHSYVVTDEEGRISEICEKEVVSPHAVAGVYWFLTPGPIMAACRGLVEDADWMGYELYLSHAIGRLVAAGFRFFACPAKTAILGTPEDFQRFEVAMQLCS